MKGWEASTQLGLLDGYVIKSEHRFCYYVFVCHFQFVDEKE